MVRDLSVNYEWSSCYDRLLEIMQGESIVCVVDCQHCRDIAQTICVIGQREIIYTVCARGICYISAVDKDNFISQCKAINLRFIDPIKPVASADNGGE